MHEASESGDVEEARLMHEASESGDAEEARLKSGDAQAARLVRDTRWSKYCRCCGAEPTMLRLREQGTGSTPTPALTRCVSFCE